MTSVCECAFNVTRGHIKLSQRQKNHLKKHCKGLLRLTDKKVSLENKRKTIQTGGLLPALIGVLGPLLGKLLR